MTLLTLLLQLQLVSNHYSNALREEMFCLLVNSGLLG